MESLSDLPRITSQIYDGDNSQPIGTDTLKAPQSHHLKNVSCVINIPHLGMFIARHCYQQQQISRTYK